MVRKLFLILIVALCLSAPSSASAYWPYGYGAYGGWGYGYGWGIGTATQYRPAPPYFALYPPVYYSPHITARHYGASPFAWSGGMQPITYVSSSATMEAAEPMVVENPYVSAPMNRRAATGELKPLKMSNPFVVSAER